MQQCLLCVGGGPREERESERDRHAERARTPVIILLICPHRLTLPPILRACRPKLITDIRDFLQKARRRDAKLVKIRKRPESTKFKIRCSKYMYTLTVPDAEKADKLTQSLPPGLQRKDI